jgi:uncharacterized RDD family membrane protein YckC
MNREQQLKSCKVCTKRKFDRRKGIVCSLTDEQATFVGDCESFDKDIDYSERYSGIHTGEVIDSKSVSSGTRFANYVIDRIVITILNIVVFTIYTPDLRGDFPLLELYLIAGSVIMFYYVIMEVLFQATVGKLITGSVVVDMYGEQPEFGVVVKRSFCRLIPFDAFSYLGSSAIGWHDTFSSTRVILKKEIGENKSNSSDVLDEDFS